MGRFVTFFSWEKDAPHLNEEARAEILKSIPPHQRRARTEGVPYLGAGTIYSTPLEEILVDHFPIPDYWPRCFGMDVGWNKTAALWLAIDRETDIAYAYSEHYVGQEEPLLHAAAIMGSGNGNERAPWIPGYIDPASKQKNQNEGKALLTAYRNLGLKLELANNAVEAGIYEVWQRLSTGRLKFFRHLKNLQWEYNIYRRNDKGQVVKKNDHLCDCLRYACMSGITQAKVAPSKEPVNLGHYVGGGAQSWMGT